MKNMCFVIAAFQYNSFWAVLIFYLYTRLNYSYIYVVTRFELDFFILGILSSGSQQSYIVVYNRPRKHNSTF